MSRLKDARNEAWYRGNLKWKLHAAQKEIDLKFTASTGQLFLACTSRQFGKSFWAVCKALEQAIKKPQSQIRYGAAFQTDLVEFIIPAFDKILQDCPKSVKPTYKSSGTSYVFPNGSKIKLVGLDKNPNGLRGNTLDLIILDECGFVSNLDYLYKSVIIPATMHLPNARVVMISTPPSTPAHPFIEYAQRAEAEGCFARFTIYDNPLIDSDTINRLIKESGGEDSTTFRREYLAEFITDADLAIIPEWKDEYVAAIETDEFYQYYHKYCGMDLGVKDNTACIFGYYDFKRASLIIEDEFKMNGSQMNTELLVGAIRAKEAVLWGDTQPFRRISDNNNLHLLQDFSSIHNLTFVATTKDSLEAMINEVRIMVQNRQIIINPRCTDLIGCLKYGVWNSKKTEFARSNVYGHFDHLAALIYLVRNLAKGSNPIPATHGHEQHTSWLGHVTGARSASKNARAIAEVFKPKKRPVGDGFN